MTLNPTCADRPPPKLMFESLPRPLLRTSAEAWRVANCQREFPALVERLRALAPERIIVEASGGRIRTPRS